MEAVTDKIFRLQVQGYDERVFDVPGCGGEQGSEDAHRDGLDLLVGALSFLLLIK